MNPESCYLFIEDNCIKAMCLNCHPGQHNSRNIVGMWDGTEGYGINDKVICAVCNKIIYEKDKTTV